MKPLPLPVRLAAGLAVTAVEQARKLPGHLVGLPVTVVSEALQLSMRVQQRVTELAIKGDDALSLLRPVEQEPEWATFDEDEDDPGVGDAGRDAGRGAGRADDGDDDGYLAGTPGEPGGEDPWAEEERALAAAPPAVLPNYEELSLAQLRARLRTLSAEELELLLTHERTHAARPEFLGMITRRIANLTTS